MNSMQQFKTENLLRIEEMSEVKVEKARADGKKSREYYTLMFSDASNPLKHWRTRNFFQQHSPDGTETYWRGSNPTDARVMIGSTIKGEIMKVPVATYTIVDGTGVHREVDNFTIVIFDGESIEEVTRGYGHLHAQSNATVGSARTDVGNMPSTEQQVEQSRINSANNRITDQPTALGERGTYARSSKPDTKEEDNKKGRPDDEGSTPDRNAGLPFSTE